MQRCSCWRPHKQTLSRVWRSFQLTPWTHLLPLVLLNYKVLTVKLTSEAEPNRTSSTLSLFWSETIFNNAKLSKAGEQMEMDAGMRAKACMDQNYLIFSETLCLDEIIAGLQIEMRSTRTLVWLMTKVFLHVMSDSRCNSTWQWCSYDCRCLQDLIYFEHL